MTNTATQQDIDALHGVFNASPAEFDEFLDSLGYGYRTNEELKELIGKDYVPFIGLVEVVDSYGGEGQGDEYWKVFRFKDRYFRVNAYYSSWDGVNFDMADIEEVFPEEVTTIVYKTKKK